VGRAHCPNGGSDTRSGSGTGIAPDVGSETFTVNTPSTYPIDGSANVTTFSGAHFRLAVVVTLVNVTGGGETFTLAGSPSTGATISFTRVN
jgi:hypothetical protein